MKLCFSPLKAFYRFSIFSPRNLCYNLKHFSAKRKWDISSCPRVTSVFNNNKFQSQDNLKNSPLSSRIDNLLAISPSLTINEISYLLSYSTKDGKHQLSDHHFKTISKLLGEFNNNSIIMTPDYIALSYRVFSKVKFMSKEELLLTAELTRQLQMCNDRFHLDLISSMLQNFNKFTGDKPFERILLSEINKKLANCIGNMNDSLAWKVMVGLTNLKTHNRVVRELIKLLTPLFYNMEEPFSPRTVRFAMYGLTGSKNCVEIHNLLNVFSSKIRGCTENMNPYEISIAYLGCKDFTTEDVSVVSIIEALNLKFKNCELPFNTRQLSLIMLGAKKFNSDHKVVRELFFIINNKLSTCYDEFSNVNIEIFIRGFDYKNSVYPEIRELFSAFTRKITNCDPILSGPFPASKLIFILNVVKNFKNSKLVGSINEDFLLMLKFINLKLNSSAEMFTGTDITLSLKFLSNLSNETQEIFDYIKVISKKITSSNEKLTIRDLSIAHSGLVGLNQNQPEVDDLLNYLTEQLVSCELTNNKFLYLSQILNLLNENALHSNIYHKTLMIVSNKIEKLTFSDSTIILDFLNAINTNESNTSNSEMQYLLFVILEKLYLIQDLKKPEQKATISKCIERLSKIDSNLKLSQKFVELSKKLDLE